MTGQSSANHTAVAAITSVSYLHHILLSEDVLMVLVKLDKKRRKIHSYWHPSREWAKIVAKYCINITQHG